MALEKIVLKKGTSTAEAYTTQKVDALLANKQPTGNYATLENGKIPASQLPAFVDDVLEFDSVTDFPEVGTSGVIYIAKDTNKTYRWGGSAYVEISESLALGETAGTAFEGSKGKALQIAVSDLSSSKANKATTLDGYSITDAYTSTQVDSKLEQRVPLQKTMTTYTAFYGISDGQIQIFLKHNTSQTNSIFQITPTAVSFKGQQLATMSDLPDISGKADHTVVATSTDGKTITFTFD